MYGETPRDGLSDVAVLTLIAMFGMVLGPLLFLGSFDRSGNIKWVQLAFALAGTGIWAMLLWGVIQ